MQTIQNQDLFTTRVFDSGALGVLGSVIHQFAEPGIYGVAIHRGENLVRSTSFEVSASSQNVQLDIDLATSVFDRAGRQETCKQCSHTEAAGQRVVKSDVLPTVSPKGYVLFFVSRGEGGYSVKVGTDRNKQPVFDSTVLAKGDMFALSLLAPTRYSMENRLGRVRGVIDVTLSEKALRNLADVPAVSVDVARDAFTPESLKTVSGQGIVFRVTDVARIVVEQAQEPQEVDKPRRRRAVAPKRPHR